MQKQIFAEMLPIFNFSLQDLPGEIWRPVVGAEKLALISQYGRVKRIARRCIANTGANRYYKEMIYRSDVNSFYSFADKRFKYTLECTISAKHLRYIFNPMRMVYHQFCKEFPLSDTDFVVSTINEDDLDIRSENLRLSHTVNAKVAKFSAPGKYSDRTKIQLFKNATFSRSLIYRRQLISCYNDKGQRVKTYDDIYQAHLKTRHLISEIEQAITKPFSKLGMYFWRSGKIENIDVKLFVKEEKRIKKEAEGFKITQFNLNGEPIDHYWSLQDAAKANHLTKPTILACLTGEQATAGHFLWKEGHWRIPIPGL